jgi:hypothetical protein
MSPPESQSPRCQLTERLRKTRKTLRVILHPHWQPIRRPYLNALVCPLSYQELEVAPPPRGNPLLCGTLDLCHNVFSLSEIKESGMARYNHGYNSRGYPNLAETTVTSDPCFTVVITELRTSNFWFICQLFKIALDPISLGWLSLSLLVFVPQE